MLGNLLRLLHDVLSLAGETLPNQSENRIHGIRCAEEVARRCGLPDSVPAKIVTKARQKHILAAGSLLPQPVSQLGAIHAKDATPDLLPSLKIHGANVEFLSYDPYPFPCTYFGIPMPDAALGGSKGRFHSCAANSGGTQWQISVPIEYLVPAQ
jgi:hypothetical protein